MLNEGAAINSRGTGWPPAATSQILFYSIENKVSVACRKRSERRRVEGGSATAQNAAAGKVIFDRKEGDRGCRAYRASPHGQAADLMDICAGRTMSSECSRRAIPSVNGVGGTFG